MPRPVWTGDISFGLVTIPISILPVEEKNELRFHLLDSRDEARVQYQRVNATTGKLVPWEKIVKGYEFDNDRYLVVDEKAFEKASPDMYKSIDIEEFVDLKEIDSLYFEKPYYCIPNSKNKKAYVLLREALKKTNKVGVAKIILRTKEYLSLVLPHEHSLLLYLIHFKEELREEEELHLPKEALKHYKIRDQEIKMAEDLINDMTVQWKPEKYHNEYREALSDWIENKVKTIDGKASTKKVKGHMKKEDVVDFITLLKRSMKKKAAAKKKHSLIR